VGIFKIAERMIARDRLAGPILDLLGNLFILPSQASFRTTPGAVPPLSSQLLSEVSGQVSAGMWRLLTMNVASLPSLGLEQWQILFDIIGINASSGGYASIKAFEAMAWLLHEPRLRAEVPVFCVVGVKPLLCNHRAPLSVSVGAVQLLTHLHSRLEVLVKEEGSLGYSEMGSDGDAPVLWESCWAPILRALADGANDDRNAVRVAAVDALSRSVADKHALAVPAGVMVDILGDIIVPTVLLLGESLFQSCMRGESTEGVRTRSDSRQLRDEEMLEEVLGSVSASEEPPYSVEVFRSPKETSSTHTFPSGGNTLARALLAAHQKNDSSTSSMGPAVECLNTLCDAFLRQLRKLSSYPSFDKLWLRILHVLGYFLGAPHGYDPLQLPVPSSRQHQQNQTTLKQLAYAEEAAKNKLQQLLLVLISAGIFRSRTGLWTVSLDTIAQFRPGCQPECLKEKDKDKGNDPKK